MEETKNELTRRGFLRNGSAAVGAIGLAAGLGAGSLIDIKKADAAATSLELPVLPLDVERVRMYAYCEYHANNGCGQGSGRALVLGFIDAAKKAGMKRTGWSLLPPKFTQWGATGGLGWGGTCGSLCGTTSILCMATVKGVQLHTKILDPLWAWYQEQPFPLGGWDKVKIDRALYPNVPAPIADAEVAAHPLPKSPLCHVSISKWMKHAGVDLDTKDKAGRYLKKDRCSKVTGDTAAKAAELINAYLASASIPAFEATKEYAECYTCHTSARNIEGKQNCTPCHTDKAVIVSKDHP